MEILKNGNIEKLKDGKMERWKNCISKLIIFKLQTSNFNLPGGVITLQYLVV
jgi:hypothetical protein